MGPALAPADATLSGDVENIRLLWAQFGNPQLAPAAAQVSQRAMTLREDFDGELVVELTIAHLATWSVFDQFVNRQQDRLRMASGAMRSAHSQALRELRDPMRAALACEDDLTASTYRPNPFFVRVGLAVTFGLAYMTTLTFVHMSTTSG